MTVRMAPIRSFKCNPDYFLYMVLDQIPDLCGSDLSLDGHAAFSSHKRDRQHNSAPVEGKGSNVESLHAAVVSFLVPTVQLHPN